MWQQKLGPAVFAPLTPLTISNEGSFGKYLWVGPGDWESNRKHGEPFAVGQLIGEGDEAKVYEFVNLRTGSWAQVVKICKFPPNHPKYKQWLSDEPKSINPYSKVPDIENMQSYLLPAKGGFVKIQTFHNPQQILNISGNQDVQNSMRSFAAGKLEEALSSINTLIDGDSEEIEYQLVKAADSTLKCNTHPIRQHSAVHQRQLLAA